MNKILTKAPAANEVAWKARNNKANGSKKKAKLNRISFLFSKFKLPLAKPYTKIKQACKNLKLLSKKFIAEIPR